MLNISVTNEEKIKKKMHKKDRNKSTTIASDVCTLLKIPAPLYKNNILITNKSYVRNYEKHNGTQQRIRKQWQQF